MRLPNREEMLYSQLVFMSAFMSYFQDELKGTKFETNSVNYTVSQLDQWVKTLEQVLKTEINKDEANRCRPQGYSFQ